MRIEVRLSEKVSFVAQVRYEHLLSESGALITDPGERAEAVVSLLETEIIAAMTGLGEGYAATPVIVKPEGYRSDGLERAEEAMQDALRGWCERSEEWTTAAADAVTDSLFDLVQDTVRQWVLEHHEEVVREHHWAGC